MLIGVALMDCVGVSLNTFSQQIREGQMTGSLEATLMSPVHLPLVLMFSSLYAYFFAGLRFLIYIFLGIGVYGVRMSDASLAPAVVVFALTVLCCAGIGIIWASIIMVIKRGESILSLGGYLILFLSGVVFPVESFDGWLRTLAGFVPLTHGLEGMRLALLRGQDFVQLMPIILKLIGFTVVLLAIGLVSFEWAVLEAKSNGSLTEF
jgi:ABC-2 type transport system permease protein